MTAPSFVPRAMSPGASRPMARPRCAGFSTWAGLVLAAVFSIVPVTSGAQQTDATPQTPRIHIAPVYGHEAEGLERLGDVPLAATGFAENLQVLGQGDASWLTIGATGDGHKHLSFFAGDAGTGAIQLAELGGPLDDVWSFVMARAPFEVEGRVPVAVLSLRNFGGACCEHHEAHLFAGLLDGGALLGRRSATVAVTDHENAINPGEYGPWVYPGANLDDRGRKEDARFFFLAPAPGVEPSLVVWRKACRSRTYEDTRRDRRADRDPCGWGFELTGERFDRYQISADGLAAPIDLASELRPPASLWRKLQGLGSSPVGITSSRPLARNTSETDGPRPEEAP